MKNRPKRLRWHLASALIVTTVLLWLGFVLLAYNSRLNELEDTVGNTFQSTRSTLQTDALSAYQENRANGLGERADHILMSHLSGLSMNGIESMDGGTALAVKLGETLVRSQITWGQAEGGRRQSGLQRSAALPGGRDHSGVPDPGGRKCLPVGG